MEGCKIPFGSFGKLLEGYISFLESFGVNRGFSKKSENLKFRLRGTDIGRKCRPSAQNCGSQLLGPDFFGKSPDLCRETNGGPSVSGHFRREGPKLFGLDNPGRNVISFPAEGFGDIVTIGVLTLSPFPSSLTWRVQEGESERERERA